MIKIWPSQFCIPCKTVESRNYVLARIKNLHLLIAMLYLPWAGPGFPLHTTGGRSEIHLQTTE